MSITQNAEMSSTIWKRSSTHYINANEPALMHIRSLKREQQKNER